ncbi:MAG TPA: MFS transporter [Sphingomicrobium sp.]|nr:MFS transporter [Sphingomicrobium sp.]
MDQSRSRPAHSETPVLPPHSLAIAAFSTVVEWYDFTLYLYFATVLARTFYGGGSGSLLLTLGGFAVAYLMRPLGAIVFSHIGDRRGRRHMLLISVALMTCAMLATALMPTRAAIGPTAGWLLLGLRCVMGFSVGGEYTGVVAYLLEGAPERRRGLITSSASAASELGALLAVGVSALTVSLMNEADLQRWGWRIPFFVGAALAGAVGIARTRMDESPEFLSQKERGTVPKLPIGHAVTNHRRGIARGFAISALGSITYYVGITYVPSFLTSVGGMSEQQSLWLSTIAAVAVILVTPLTGLLADHIGRRPVLRALCLASAALPITMFSLMSGKTSMAALAGAVILALLAGAISAVGAVSTAEQFPGEARISGLALGATTATAIFGGLTPFVAQLMVEKLNWPSAPGVMIAIVAVGVFPVILTIQETAPARNRSAVPKL